MTRRREKFEVGRNILEKIFFKLNAINTDDSPKKRDRIMMKATRILYGITFRQPFYEGNKTTALFATVDFLRQNGFDLPLETVTQEQEVFDLLVLVMYGSRESEDVRDFLDKKVVTYTTH